MADDAGEVLVRSLLGGALLGLQAGVFVLRSVAPDGGLLLTQEGDIAGGLTAARTGRGTPTRGVAGRGGAKGGRRRIAGDGAEGVDRGRATVVAHAGRWLL